MMDSSESENRYPEASRRTYFAQERTLLAWWRTGIAIAAVALAIGGLLPRLSHTPRVRFIALGIGYGVLAPVFVIEGSLRDRVSRQALEINSFAELPTWMVATVTGYITLLVVLMVAAFV